uniref:Uncharacterized protein n=1 Tax=Terrapene triunguis TaxID=2587831 RepID=A0A674IC88_9SAUR
MRSHPAILLVSLLVICHSVYAAILEFNGSYKSCRCIKQTSDFISPRRYESIEIIPFGGALEEPKYHKELLLCYSQPVWIQEVLEIFPNKLGIHFTVEMEMSE